MTSDQLARPRRHTRLWLALAIVCVVIALFVLPPLVSIARYKNRVTQLVSAALHRPVRLSSVELRMLPRPGFLLTDLTVEEDPIYGSEPVLHANTVTASIRLWSLWRGELQISRISVDEASLNLVRTPEGRWNIEALFQTAAKLPQDTQRRSVPLPYMEATNSRINIKNGMEKLPYSLVNTDASLWHESGAWRVRFRGQPARTDVALDLADTGILRAEATLHPAPRLEQMPLHLDLDWRQAQLGQLSRLLLGSDEGWRGNLTGELHVDGTAEAAQIKSRLRASGVHRAEFTPSTPLDFDATCSLNYRGTKGGIEKLLCESPVGDGRARLTGAIPGNGNSPDLTLELDRVPAQAGIDALRTVRSNLDEDLEAAGSVSGKMSYKPVEASPVPPATHRRAAKTMQPPAPPQPFHGSFSVDGLRISGDKLSAPIAIAKMTLEPAEPVADQPAALSTTVSIPAGEPNPVTVNARLGITGFQVSLHGGATLKRLRDLERLTGLPATSAMDQIAGDPVMLDVSVEDNWLSNPILLPGAAPSVLLPSVPTEHVRGTITLHDANWKPEFLANPVLISGATLHLEDAGPRWDNVAFTYGPVKGTGSLQVPTNCDPEQAGCIPQFSVHFASLDMALAQSALLGAHEQGTLLSTLLSRLKPSTTSAWPKAKGTIQADSLLLGPFTFNAANAQINLLPSGAEVTSFDARALGGTVHAAATLDMDNKPAYSAKGTFSQLNPQLVGQLFGMRWSGGQINGTADLALSGFSDLDLASSAKGTVHFDWRNGAITGQPGLPVLASVARFDHWTGDLTVASGGLTLGKNEIVRGGRKSQVEATAAFGAPARITFGAPPASKR